MLSSFVGFERLGQLRVCSEAREGFGLGTFRKLQGLLGATHKALVCQGVVWGVGMACNVYLSMNEAASTLWHSSDLQACVYEGSVGSWPWEEA